MTPPRIRVALDRQRLDLFDGAGGNVASFPVSTARNGPGELYGSECTPRGQHRVRARIGAGCPINTVFVRRRPTGEIWTPVLAASAPGRDWMVTRILWLTGCESGYNRGGDVDTMRRKIYIHGTGDDAALGHPASHGCIRMSNAGVVDLFERVPIGTAVEIVEVSGQPFRVRVARWDDDQSRLRGMRGEVFVLEQRVGETLEWDNRDATCRHVIAEDLDGAAVGCGRLLPDGDVGRLAVRHAWRGRGVGGAILERLIDMARYAGLDRVALNARTDAEGFYGRFGFRATGSEFVEAGIRHCRMQRDTVVSPA